MAGSAAFLEGNSKLLRRSSRFRKDSVELSAEHIFDMSHRFFGLGAPMWCHLTDDRKAYWRDVAATVVDGEWNLMLAAQRNKRA